jgi:hypothetical protein
MHILNTIYTFLTLALLFLVINFFASLVEIPQSVVVIVLVLSAFVFFLRMYLRYSNRKP